MFGLAPVFFEDAAASLEASGNYRVLRRVPVLPEIPAHRLGDKRGIFLDLETTGLDPVHDEIIQIAMVEFTYDAQGRILGVGETFCRYREPLCEIPQRVTDLTGIDLSMVRGKCIDPVEIELFALCTHLIIAHNAGFDRRFLERFSPFFKLVPWACSLEQVPWLEEGFEGTKLPYLLMRAGMFHEAHKADADCHAALALLSLPLPKCGVPAFSKLLEAALAPTFRFWAVGAAFELKGVLKARGYRWNNGDHGTPRSWYRDVPESGREQEAAFLGAHMRFSGVDATITEIDAMSRFSERM